MEEWAKVSSGWQTNQELVEWAMIVWEELGGDSLSSHQASQGKREREKRTT